MKIMPKGQNKRNCLISLVIASLFFALTIGCATRVANLSRYTGVKINPSTQNFRVVKANLTGQSYGFRLLGFIPIVPATYSRAEEALYLNAGIQGTTNTVLLGSVETSQIYLFLFSIPKLTIKANIVELLDKGEKK